jgi:hypothetical protein
MPAEFKSAAREHDHHHHHCAHLLQDDQTRASHPAFPIMPDSSSSSESSQQNDGQQRREQGQQQPRTSTETSSSANNNEGEDVCPDPRLAVSAAAAAAEALNRDPATGAKRKTASTSANNAIPEYQRLVKRYRVEVAASASSVLSSFTTFPLDSIKTRMQTYRYSGFVDCVRHTYRTEHLRGFFRGRATVRIGRQSTRTMVINSGMQESLRPWRVLRSCGLPPFRSTSVANTTTATGLSATSGTTSWLT